MGSHSVVTLTTAEAGAGKSYRRCAHFIVTELLPETDLVHWSNFPIHLDPWGDGKRGLIEVCRLRGVSDEESIRERIKVIPKDVEDSWRDGESGPWDFFSDKLLTGCHIAIDEIHNFCGKNTAKAVKQKWSEWLGEIRHRGARIEFISQHPQKIAIEIRHEAGVQLELVPGERMRDPWFAIEMGDWYNLAAKVTGNYKPCVFELESHQYRTRWTVKNTKRFWFESDLFEVYDSFSTPVQGGKKGQLDLKPYERFSWVRLAAWFSVRNAWPLGSRSALVAGMVWLSMFNGGSKLFALASGGLESSVGKKPAAVEPADRPVKPTVLDSLKEQYPGATFKDGSGRVLAAPVAPVVVEARPPPDPEEAAALAKSWVVSAVTSEGVWFRNGEFYLVGEEIEYGPFKSQRVVRVDLSRRRIYLDVDMLRLGSGSSDRLRSWSFKELTERAGSSFSGLLQ